MVHLEFRFRPSTEEEILIFSEEFSNECRLNPEVKFITAELQDKNYAIFAMKEEADSPSSEITILFFLILDHPLKTYVNIYHLFCTFINEMTFIEPVKENLRHSKRICWNLENEQYRTYFEEVINKNGKDTSMHTLEYYKKHSDSSIQSPHFYKDGLFVQYNYVLKTWKEKVNHVDRYYFEQKLSDYSEEEKSPEWYSDFEYATKLHFIRDLLDALYYRYFAHRHYDRETKKVIPFTEKEIEQIESTCNEIMKYCSEYSTKNAILTPFLKKEFDLVKKYCSEYYDKIWQSQDINEPYFSKTKQKLAYMFRTLRGLKLPGDICNDYLITRDKI